jgi:uncharacterized protein (DUF2252 family)
MSNILSRIQNFNHGRLPDILQLKYAAMAENAFRFYRGTCHLFYEDLSKVTDFPASPATWICGDMHIENFGSYKGDNRLVYFDLNDFDEAILAPCLWEISRMATSIFIAFEELRISKAEALRIVKHFVKTYADTLAKGKPVTIDPRTARGIVCDFLTQVENRKPKELFKKRTTKTKKGKLVFSAEYEKYRPLDNELKAALFAHVDQWIKKNAAARFDFKVQDAMFRIAGTGSLGVKRYVFLLKGQAKHSKHIILDMKQALPSSVGLYTPLKQPAWENQAERVIAVKGRLQNVAPALLGATLFRGDSYVVQEMQPTEDRINFELIKDQFRDIDQVVCDMAVLAASAQLRSSGRQGSAIADKLIVFGEKKEWQEQLLDYALKYAARVKKDYKQYLEYYKEGKFS